jgi:ferredoxin, 2Fe-2S
VKSKSLIRFTLTYRGATHSISTIANEYRNLMALLYDKFYFENFGECKGVGRCGTCHIKIEQGNAELLKRVGNEHSTLSKMDDVSENSRLSCQIPLTDHINDLHFTVITDDE